MNQENERENQSPAGEGQEGSEYPGYNDKGQPVGGGVAVAGHPEGPPPWAFVLPFFLSGVFFLSGIFSIFAPLPLMMLGFHNAVEERPWFVFLAVLSNTIIVSLAGQGWVFGGIYFSAVGVLALSLRHFLFHAKWSVERSFVTTLLLMFLSAGVFFALYSSVVGSSPFAVFENQVALVVEELRKASGTGGMDWEMSPEELKRSVMVELPSAIAIFSLVLLWCNFILVYRLYPARMLAIGVGPDFIRNWKAPDYLVWPTLASAGMFFLMEGLPREIGLNFFKFLMAIYGIQGLSILSFAFDTWKIRGLFRSVMYILVILPPLTPILLIVGFLDLWFDVRTKFLKKLTDEKK